MITVRLFKLSILFLLVFITACTGLTSSDAIYHNRFQFEQVKTYSIYQQNSAFAESQNLSRAMRNSIEIAIEKNMEQLNFSYVDVKDADLIATYHIFTNGRDFSIYNKSVLFCEYCLKANAWKETDGELNIKRGGLIIDLVDPDKKRSVWRSTQALKIKTKDNSQEVNEKIQYAVSSMLKQYPKIK